MLIRIGNLSVFLFVVLTTNYQGIFANDKNSDQILQQADTLFQATLYTKAIPLYKQFLKGGHVDEYVKKDILDHSRLQLAKSYLYCSDYNACLDTIEGNPATSEEWYLFGIANSKLQRYPQAIEAFNTYIRSAKAENLSFYDHAVHELALSYYLDGKGMEAQKLFEKVIDQAKDSHLSNIASLYLARIYIDSEDPQKAKNVLTIVQKKLLEDDLLQHEVAYLFGEVYDLMNDHKLAANYFEKALPIIHPEKVDWYKETMFRLGRCYVEIGKDFSLPKIDREAGFKKAELIYQTLLNTDFKEKAYLALGQSYLECASSLHDPEAYLKAENHLSKSEVLLSPEAQAQALLHRAEAAATYAERDMLYRNLTQEKHCDSPCYAKGWYLRGLNDYEEGKSLLNANKEEEAFLIFSNAANAFKMAKTLFLKTDPILASQAEKYHLQSLLLQNDKEKFLEALSSAELFLENQIENIDEILYLYACIAERLEEEKYQEIAVKTLLEIYELYPKGKYADASLNMLGTMFYTKAKYEEAEATFLKLADKFPESRLAGDALYWAARCSDARADFSKSKLYRQGVFEKYPHSPFAAEAYFTTYSFHEYAQGDRQATKHLQMFPEKYPNSLFVIPAWYLIGLDLRRDRKSVEGKWIRKKNLTEAIEAFQASEEAFNSLYNEGNISAENLEYYAAIRYRANLERALANLAISDESQGAKRQIYLEYAEEVLRQLLNELKNESHPLYSYFLQLEPFGRIEEESAYWLGQVLIKEGKDAEAEQIYANVLEKYQSGKITRGYLLSRIWYEKGMIALRKRDDDTALKYFRIAEDAAKGRVLSADQRLDLWIQQNYCYREKQDYDNALLLLSKVINDDSISALRIKAMYLRAEIYELQGRHELARRQLESASKQGGEWAIKAKERLVKEYGYPNISRMAPVQL